MDRFTIRKDASLFYALASLSYRLAGQKLCVLERCVYSALSVITARSLTWWLCRQLHFLSTTPSILLALHGSRPIASLYPLCSAYRHNGPDGEKTRPAASSGDGCSGMLGYDGKSWRVHHRRLPNVEDTFQERERTLTRRHFPADVTVQGRFWEIYNINVA